MAAQNWQLLRELGESISDAFVGMLQELDAQVQEGGGGSQTVRAIRLPIAFDTPNLVLTGVPLFTPVVGDYIGNYSFVAVPVLTAWNGTTPVLHFGVSGALAALDSTMSPSAGAVDLTQAVTPIASAPAATVGGTGAGNNAPMIFTATTPVTVMVDDGAGGDPGSDQGAGEIIVLLLSH